MIKCFNILILFIFTGFMCCFGYTVPAMGIPILKEEEIGREVFETVKKRYTLVDDLIIAEYITEIGEKIVSTISDSPFQYHFYVIDAPTYNAFASPGGYIFIHSGLIAAMDQESELAGIISHEIAHVQCRHISQLIEKSQKIQFATLAGLIAGVLVGAGGAGEVGSAMSIGSVAAAQTAALAYSRENEMQADQIGLVHLAQAGYAGDGLLAILKKIRDKSIYTDDYYPTYLSTHPAVRDRIAYLDTMMEHAGNTKTVNHSSNVFNKIKTRIIGMYGKTDFATSYFQQRLTENSEDLWSNYGYALTLSRTGNHLEALEHMRNALKHKPFDAHILSEMGRLYLENSQLDEALSTLQAAVDLDSSAVYPRYLLGCVLLENDQPALAVKTLEMVLNHLSDYAPAHYEIGQAYGRMEQQATAYYHIGIYYALNMDLMKARFHLERAMESNPDPDLKLKIDEQLKALPKKMAKPEDKP